VDRDLVITEKIKAKDKYNYDTSEEILKKTLNL
jgi:hypothetical protein